MLPEQFVFLGVILTLISTAIYLVATLKGEVKPNRVTFFIWALAPLIAFAAQISQGIGIQSLMTFAIGFGTLLIFIASFINKNAVWKLGKLDFICGGLSLMGLFLWFITQTGNIAILFSILADALAAVPTIVKAYKAPETENGLAYSLAGLGSIFTLLTINKWNFAMVGFPLYIIVCNFIIFIVIQRKFLRQYLK